MAKFLTKLRLELDNSYPDIGDWVVVSPLIYHSDINNIKITVPVMFYTDLATIPRFIYPILDKADKIIVAASVVHDYLYVSGELERKIADKILKEAMLISDSNEIIANLAYLSVRIFGKSKYKG